MNCLMNKDLYARVCNHVPIGTWFDLDQILKMIDSKSKSYVKMSLFAMDGIEARRVMTATDNPKTQYLPDRKKWKWQFRRVK